MLFRPAGMAGVDRRLGSSSAVCGREPTGALDGRNVTGQALVLDRAADPGRVIPCAEVVRPDPIVCPGRDPREQPEVLDADGLSDLPDAEVGAAVFLKLASL
jgi:hypothetical protein